jgi:succinoglycan biosynthesis transport protein ExoP
MTSLQAETKARSTGLLSKLGARVFRTSEQVEQASSLQPSPHSTLQEHVLDAPHSRFTESFRNIKVLVDSAQRESRDKVIGVVSPVANNGKSTIATNLATLMATSARTLVIDGDLHKRKLTVMLKPDAREGLMEALDDPSRLAELVTKRPRSGLDFLPCVLSKRIPNASELLGSPQMERLLTAARDSYDYIVVECPPVMSVVDVKMIERFLDSFVFVAEWGQTTQRVAQEALDECDITRERTVCIVLNKVDPSELRRIEAYKGPRHRDYYET